VVLRQALGGALQVQLDDFRGARADEEQQLDVRAAGEKAVHHRIKFGVDVGEPGQIAFVDDGGGKAWLGEDHDARRRLDEMGAGARTDDEEEGILDLAVQPDDAGEAAEHFALAALLQNRLAGASGQGFRLGGRAEGQVHDAASADPNPVAARSSLALLSFSRNWAALIT
jgi:hypothetical protein